MCLIRCKWSRTSLSNSIRGNRMSADRSLNRSIGDILKFYRDDTPSPFTHVDSAESAFLRAVDVCCSRNTDRLNDQLFIACEMTTYYTWDLSMAEVHRLTASLLRQGLITCEYTRTSTFAKKDGLYARGISLTMKSAVLLPQVARASKAAIRVRRSRTSSKTTRYGLFAVLARH